MQNDIGIKFQENVENVPIDFGYEDMFGTALQLA